MEEALASVEEGVMVWSDELWIGATVCECLGGSGASWLRHEVHLKGSGGLPIQKPDDRAVGGRRRPGTLGTAVRS